MPRTLRDTKLDNRTSRERLKARGRPYWRSLEVGLHLGYRRISGAPGRWCVRRYVGDQAYKVEIIGTADDHADADGDKVLDFRQAQLEALNRLRRDRIGSCILVQRRSVEQHGYRNFKRDPARSCDDWRAIDRDH
jgi:hypothetical protein